MYSAAQPQRATPPTFADVYDRVVGEDFWGLWWRAFERTVADCQLTFTSVCDVACGTGETVRRLSRRRLVVHGIDVSEDMIRVAQAKCRGVDVHLQVQDMLELSLPKPVDLLICSYDTLNQLNGEAVLATAFRRFFDTMTPGGHMVFDMATLRHLEMDWGTGEIHAPVDEIDSIWHTRWDGNKRAVNVRVTISLPWAGAVHRIVEQIIAHGYPKATIDRVVRDAGFTIIDVRDMVPWTPGDDHGTRLFYLIQRPA